MSSPERLHALDAVRAFALLLGVVLHAAMSFVPGMATQGFPIIDNSPSVGLGIVFYVIHIFRMTTFFVIAGFFARLVLHRKGTAAFIQDRSRRILLPLLVGWVACTVLIILVMVWALCLNNGGQLPERMPGNGYVFSTTHLWFLYYLLWMYAIALLIRSVCARIDPRGALGRALDRLLRWLMTSNLAPVAAAVPSALVLYAIDHWQIWGGIPTPDKSLIPEWPALIGYGIAFGLGWLLQRQIELLRVWERRWLLNLGIALLLALVSLGIGTAFSEAGIATEGWRKATFAAIYALATWTWTAALIGIGMRFCSNESPLRRYLADASYWLYLAHLPLVFALQAAVMHADLHWSFKFPFILLTACAVLLVSYHYWVRSTFIGAVLNGRKYPRSRAELPGKAHGASTSTDFRSP